MKTKKKALKEKPDSVIRGRTFLREWRKYLKLSQEVAAGRIGITQATLSKIERRELPYNQDFIEQVALAYGRDTDELLFVNPMQPDPPRLVYSALRKATPEMQRKALDIIEALLKAG
jgi:transcriptional regulator with XRE-family HTH domain